MKAGVELVDMIFNLSISLIGGIVKTIASDGTEKSFQTFLCSAIIGGFAGLLTCFICMEFNMSWSATSFACGIAGFMGDSILNVFSKIVEKIMNRKMGLPTKDDEE